MLGALGEDRYAALGHVLVAPTGRPGSFVSRALERAGLRMVPAPLEIEPMRLHLIRHERTHADPACRWLRERVAEIGVGASV